MLDEIDILSFGKRKPKKPGLEDWLTLFVFAVIIGGLIYIIGAELGQWRLVNIGDSMYMWVRK